MWISKAHFEALQTMRKELIDVLEASIRGKDAFIERLQERITALEAERKAMYERIQAREDERRRPMEPLPEAEPDSWEERMRREIADQVEETPLSMYSKAHFEALQTIADQVVSDGKPND